MSLFFIILATVLATLAVVQIFSTVQRIFRRRFIFFRGNRIEWRTYRQIRNIDGVVHESKPQSAIGVTWYRFEGGFQIEFLFCRRALVTSIFPRGPETVATLKSIF